MRRSLRIGGSFSVQWRKVGRSWRLRICVRRLLCVRIEIDQLQCVNCWVIIHCLSVIWKTINHPRNALVIWSSLQLTSKQWIITQQFTAGADLFLKYKSSNNRAPVSLNYRMHRDMRFPTMWYVRPAFASRLNNLWVLRAWTPFGVSKLNKRLHRLVWVYTCQNATLLVITCHGSYILRKTIEGYENSFDFITFGNIIFKQIIFVIDIIITMKFTKMKK